MLLEFGSTQVVGNESIKGGLVAAINRTGGRVVISAAPPSTHLAARMLEPIVDTLAWTFLRHYTLALCVNHIIQVAPKGTLTGQSHQRKNPNEFLTSNSGLEFPLYERITITLIPGVVPVRWHNHLVACWI